VRKVFIDTNVLVDLIADRKPFSKFAVEIFEMSEQGRIELYTSSHTIATTHYLLSKYLSDKELREILFDLTGIMKIVAMDEDIMKRGLKSRYKDFEDGLQIVAAQSVATMDGIITRNIKDFKEADIQVYAPDEFVAKMGGDISQ
jgi:predicted nucleic acid-binding protein